MADALRHNMDAGEYKHIVLGLIFLKYISDAFEEQHAKLEAERGGGADPEDPDEYRAVRIFWVPPDARWSHIQTLLRSWAYGCAYPSSAHRARALPGWLRWYNRRRPHGSLGGRPPISRVSHVCGQYT